MDIMQKILALLVNGCPGCIAKVKNDKIFFYPPGQDKTFLITVQEISGVEEHRQEFIDECTQ